MSDDLVYELRSFAEAYPEKVFTPFSEKETQTYALIITRASAEMGRHLAPWMVRAADRIEWLEAALRDILADRPPEACHWLKDIARRALETKP